MERSLAGNFLDERSQFKVSFTVSERIESSVASASVTFSAKGLQQLQPHGSVVVNGIPMKAKQLGKQGYWYQVDIPKAARYELVVRPAMNSPESRYVLLPRRFTPHLPSRLSRASGLTVQYDGPPISNRERVFARVGSIASTASSQKWGVVLKTIVEADEITVLASAFRAVKSGRALLFVGVSSFQQPVGSVDELTFAIGQETTVNILD